MRVIFAVPFSPTVVTGGQKVVYSRAETLRRHGVEAIVWQPLGKPAWFESTAPQTAAVTDLGDDDLILVSEDVPRGFVRRSILGRGGRPILFCQNPYYCVLSRSAEPAEPPIPWAGALVVGHRHVEMIRSVEGVDRVHPVDPSVAPLFFRSAPKSLRICASPKKLPNEFRMIMEIVRARAPDLRDVAVDVLENATETEVADTMGRAAIFLSLSHREAVPLTPLEAMAAGCVVVGFHGGGGLHYADPANGRWFGHDAVEDVAHALADTIRLWRDGDPSVEAMRREGQATARRYAPEAVDGAFVAAVRSLA